MGQITAEKIDPLIRIQEEIKEVVRREEEHRQLISGACPPTSIEFEDDNCNVNSIDNNIDNDSSNSLSISPIPQFVENGHNSLNNISSLALSLNGRESIDDDSGISASPSPINGVSANANNANEHTRVVNQPIGSKDHRYIGPNCYNITPEPPRQMMLSSNVATTQTTLNKQRPFTFSPAHKGVMQRFIASRGKLQMNNNNSNATAANQIFLNTKTASVLLNTSLPNSPATATPATTPSTPFNTVGLSDALNANTLIIPTVTMSPPVIERDAEGRPIRRGYVPAEVKIQKEIRDLKAREHELKKRNKLRQSTSDLLDSIEQENAETDEDDSEAEHCYGPRQLRTAKSISELCDSTQFHNGNSPRATPSPDFDGKNYGSTMRPAMSLAQLCDLDPEEAPSPHRLIAEWENRIQQNTLRNAMGIANE